MSVPLPWAALGKCKEKAGRAAALGDLDAGALPGLGPAASASAPPESLLDPQSLSSPLPQPPPVELKPSSLQDPQVLKFEKHCLGV